MGLKFGNLIYMRHVITFSLSPFEQKAYPNFAKSILNTWHRFRSHFFRVAPPFAIGYMIYFWAKEENARLKRKNPADYANDE